MTNTQIENDRDYFVSYCINRQEGQPDIQEIMTGAEINALRSAAANYGDSLEIIQRPVPSGFIPHYSV